MANDKASGRETIVYTELELGVGGNLSLAFDDNQWKVKDGSVKYLAKNSWGSAPNSAYTDCTRHVGVESPGIHIGFSNPNTSMTPEHMRVLTITALATVQNVHITARLQATLERKSA